MKIVTVPVTVTVSNFRGKSRLAHTRYFDEEFGLGHGHGLGHDSPLYLWGCGLGHDFFRLCDKGGFP